MNAETAHSTRVSGPIRGKIEQSLRPQTKRPDPAAKRGRANDQIRLRSSDRMSDVTPRPTSVYRYYDKSGLLLYVGITSRGTSRQAEHNRDKEWWRFVAKQSVEHFEARADAERRERSLIGHYRPPFNTQHNPFHAEMRELYLAASLSGALRRRPKSEVMSELGRIRHRLPLAVVKMNRQRAILTAEPRHGELAVAIEIRSAVPLMAGKKIGGLIDFSMMGDRAMFAFDLRSIARPFTSAIAHVKADTREQRVWLHQVGVTTDGP